MIYLLEQAAYNVALQYLKEKRAKMKNEELTGCTMPDGAEGVALVNGVHMWARFSTSDVYQPVLRAWVGYAITTEMVIVDFREKNVEGREVPENTKSPENSGLSCNYYVVDVKQPTSLGKQYTAECNDIIEALGMNAQEANIFKEIWRTSAARTLGKEKAGHNAKRGAEKVAFFGLRYAFQNSVSYDDMLKTLQDMKVNG